MKKIVLMMSLLLGVTIVSCGDINITSKTNLTEKNGVNFSFKVMYDQSVGNAIKNDFMQGQLEMNNLHIDKYIDGSKTVEEINIKAKSISEFDTNENIKKVLNYRINKKDYFYKSVYIVEVRPGTAVFDIEKKYEKEIDKEIIRNIPFSNIITFDGKLLNTNAQEVVSPNEVKWNYKVGILSNSTNMMLEYEILSIWKPIVFLIGIIIVIIIIVLLMRERKKKKKSIIEKTDKY
ncbi:MAG: hypothetical protein ACRDDY_10420 [Clostridium sp.]|uniref:hypothetical protein n=1 Tax=Clostridium sp. TaxID=1506 RepID=UPI003EE56479